MNRPRINREKLAWTASVILLVVLAFQIPGTLAQRDDDYTFVRTLIDIHRRVADNYVDPVDESKLNEGAIDGMLLQLDPFSVFVPPAREEDFDRMLSGRSKGLASGWISTLMARSRLSHPSTAARLPRADCCPATFCSRSMAKFWTTSA